MAGPPRALPACGRRVAWRQRAREWLSWGFPRRALPLPSLGGNAGSAPELQRPRGGAAESLQKLSCAGRSALSSPFLPGWPCWDSSAILNGTDGTRALECLYPGFGYVSKYTLPPVWPKPVVDLMEAS